MKRMVVLLLAAMLVFSFAGCTQYDFSALDDFWQNQQEETKKAQEAADKADISSIFELTFASGAKNVEFKYSEHKAELTSRVASDKELFVKATYEEFELGGGNAKISGSLLFTLTTTLENDTYTVSSYKAEMIGSTPLSLVVDGETHDLEIEVKRSTEANGTITKTGGEFKAAITLSEPASKDLTAKVDNQRVDAGKEENPSRPPVSGDITYDQMMKDYFSMAVSAHMLSDLTETIKPDKAGTFDIMADAGKVGEATFIINDGKPVCTDFSITSSGSYTSKDEDGDSKTFSWNGSASMTISGTKNTSTFKNFKVIDVPEAPSVLPVTEFSVINGHMTTEVNASEIPNMFADAELQFDSRNYSTDDYLTMTLITSIPMNMASYPFDGNSGEITIPDAENAGFDISGTWTMEDDGSISITNGSVVVKINGKEYSCSYELDLTVPVETTEEPNTQKRGIARFLFGDTSADTLTEVDAEIINFIMQIL